MMHIGPPRVLIVEDDPDTLVIMRVNLRAAGIEPILASDGSTAMARIEAEQPDAVILDVLLPGIDGWEVLEALHETGRPRARDHLLGEEEPARHPACGRAGRGCVSGEAVRHRPAARRHDRGRLAAAPRHRPRAAARCPGHRPRLTCSSGSAGALRILAAMAERSFPARAQARTGRPHACLVHAAGRPIPARVPRAAR